MVILLIVYLSDIPQKNLNLLVYAKMVKSGLYHDMRSLILALDHPRFVALPFFVHSLTETQCPAFILNENKCKGWDAWIQNRSDFDEVFIRLGNRPSNLAEADMNAIENFVMKMYTKLSKILTNWKLPRNRRAFEQHTRRACCQAGYVWQ